MNSNKLRLLGSSEKKKPHIYINKVLWTDVHMWKACRNTCIHNRKLQTICFFFADKIFVIRPYRFKFISVMDCIRDEFIFQGLHVYSYSCELCFLFGFVVNTLMYLFNKEYRCLGNNERWFGISFIYITFTGKGWGGIVICYCALISEITYY